MRRRLLLGAVVVATFGLTGTGCGGATEAMGDEAACPGESCSPDTRERSEAIETLDRVTDVVSVSRTYGFDRGAFAAAEVEAEVTEPEQARDVALAVLAELEDWPQRPPGPSEATVVSDPRVPTDYVAREAEDLDNPYFEPCAPAACERALTDLQHRMRTEIEGFDKVTAKVRGDVLRITGTTGPDDYALAAAAARRLVFDAAVRFADRVEIEISARGPIALTLRLDDGVVCEQPPGQRVACEADNSARFP